MIQRTQCTKTAVHLPVDSRPIYFDNIKCQNWHISIVTEEAMITNGEIRE
jgi:hypothetical protein